MHIIYSACYQNRVARFSGDCCQLRL